MQSVTTSRTIPASAERVWEVLSDFQNAQANFLPAKSSERVGAVDRGLDASRRLAFKNGDVVVESVVKFDDSARSQKFEFVEHAFPVSYAAITNTVKVVSEASSGRGDGKNSLGEALTADGTCRVSALFEFVPHYGCLGRYLLAPLLKSAVDKVQAELLDNLEHFVVNGTKKDPKRYV